MLCRLLAEKGVQQAVLSPGSRNAPLLVAIAREPGIRHFVILDERSAAFFALGLAQQSGKPVALVCTSGTALLNYTPAVAEAYYQQIPLIVISADRPEEWIDQDDSQTVRQREAMRNFVKASFQIDAEPGSDTRRWYNRRTINDAYNCAVAGVPGPVHLNMPIDNPLCGVRSYPDYTVGRIDRTQPDGKLDPAVVQQLAQELSNCRRVLVVAGFQPPDPDLTADLQRLAALPNVVLLAENLSNLDAASFITTTDRLLAVVRGKDEEKYRPELIVSFGGSLISKRIKSFLRACPADTRHWSLDMREHPADTFMHLTRQIVAPPGLFFRQLAARLESPKTSTYAALWHECDRTAQERHDRFIAGAGWSDLSAFAHILPAIPANSRLQISNGTAIRYAQLFKHAHVARKNGNRGTSGIDGSTSTAAGAAANFDGITTLITGDMSFLYDSGGLNIPYIGPKLKIIVLVNGGGGIFRYIPGPSELEELESCFETAQEVNVRGYAALRHFRYFEANDETELKQLLPDFFAETETCALMAVKTPRLENAVILNRYFNDLETNKQ